MHVEFPRPVDVVLNHIMDHTAHHVDVKISMFELAAAQRAIEQMFPRQGRRRDGRGAIYRECCRRCKLYDYNLQVWLDFDGRPTTGRRAEFELGLGRLPSAVVKHHLALEVVFRVEDSSHL